MSDQSGEYSQPVSWYIVQQSATSWNIDGRIQGHTDIPLSDRVRAQIYQLARRLAQIEFNAIYASLCQ